MLSRCRVFRDHLINPVYARFTSPRTCRERNVPEPMAAEGLECPICLTLPEGEVHQCGEGHCYCVRCWDRLSEPRRCPECRRSIPKPAGTVRLSARLRPCVELRALRRATTRREAAHLAACPKVPTAWGGCGWLQLGRGDVGAGSPRGSLPYAICLRVMAPLRAQNQQLQAQNQELQRRWRPCSRWWVGCGRSAAAAARGARSRRTAEQRGCRTVGSGGRGGGASDAHKWHRWRRRPASGSHS